MNNVLNHREPTGHDASKPRVCPSRWRKWRSSLGVPASPSAPTRARTDAHAATLLTGDVDEPHARFLTGERTAEGFYGVENGRDPGIARGLAYAPYADLPWVETSTRDL